MMRFSVIATAAPALFGTLCLGAEGVFTEEEQLGGTDTDGALDVAHLMGQDGSSLGGASTATEEYAGPVSLDQEVNVRSGMKGPQEEQVPTPRLMGLKSTVFGLMGAILMVVLHVLADKDIKQKSKVNEYAAAVTNSLEEWSKDLKIAGDTLELMTMMFASCLLFAFAGASDMVRTVIRRRAARAGVQEPPPLTGLEFLFGGSLLLPLVLQGDNWGNLAFPLVAVGLSLTLYSLLNRHLYFKKQRDLQNKVALPVKPQ